MRLADRFRGCLKLISEHNATWSVFQGELRGHTMSVTSVAFSPDGKCIVSGSDDETIRLWDAETGTLLRNTTGTGMFLEGGNQPEILIKYSISPARIVCEKILE